MAHNKRERDESVHRSFRLKSTHLEELEGEAQKKGVSTNALINKILEQYLESERYRERLSLISMHVSTFRALIESIPEDKIESVGASMGSAVVKDYLASMGMKPSYENIVGLMRVAAPIASYDYEKETTKEGHVYYITHNLGKRVSLYAKGLLTAAVKEIVGLDSKVEAFENSMIFTIPHKPKHSLTPEQS